MKSLAYFRVVSGALTGLEGVPVEIEVTVMPGLPHFEITGRGDSAIRESRDRVRAAILHSGFDFPKGRVVASYAPASLPKQGSAFDLPLALAVLAASSQVVRPQNLPPSASFGELALNGRVKPVAGVLGRLLALRDQGVHHVIGPREGIAQARALDSLVYEGVDTLKEAVRRFSGVKGEPCRDAEKTVSPEPVSAFGMIDMIKGQQEGIRACLIAAAGWHPLLILGAPGCGKTLLASSLPQILPPMTNDESLEVSRIYSAARLEATSGGLIVNRPFRHPHHSVTAAALIGGGVTPQPGECTLAHRGVLFLDELTAMRPRALDALREPMESRAIHLARADWTVDYPADFLLVAASNPCRCGYLLEPGGLCRCDDAMIRRHLTRISGPLMDRFDLTVMLTRVETANLLLANDGDSAKGKGDRLRAQVKAAWEFRHNRAQDGTAFSRHRPIIDSDLGNALQIDHKALRFASNLADASLMSARSFYSMLGIARTIADLEQRTSVKNPDIAEAYHYRSRLPFAFPGQTL
ncbi:MAG TPA: YifB family Mg chelatase-like AAA ATPase [Clostridia bacterium]|nr:YifB family Mg chelatase-like AAA ATPase [Clostridia bacterium]